MTDGGFDPIAVEAEAGDTLEVTVELIGAESTHRYVLPVPAAAPPVVVRTQPSAGKRDVPLNSVIIVVFSEPIDSTTLTRETLLLRKGAAVVGGTARYVDESHLIVEFAPDAPLEPGTTYEVTATQGLHDLDGDPLAQEFNTTFSTRADAGLMQLAFLRGGNIFLVNFDGSNLIQLTTGSQDEGMSWSPDGQRIAFGRRGVDARDSREDIYVINADGSGLVQRTSGGRYQYAPSWSPDGRRIAFASLPDSLADGSERTHIFDMSADEDGTGWRTIVDSAGITMHTAWSPDGGWIAFTSDWTAPGWSSDIYLAAPDGSRITRVTDGLSAPTTRYYLPEWAPDGQRLAFLSCRGGGAGICGYGGGDSVFVSVMNVDGSGFQTLYGLDYPTGLTWSPDGTMIAFTEHYTIRWVRADGSGEGGVIIVDGEAPAWRP